MKKLSALTRVTALASTLSLALIGMPGGTALAAPLAAELDATSNADTSDSINREEGGFGYVVVSRVRGDYVWYVKVENVRKNFAGYALFNDDNSWETDPCTLPALAPVIAQALGRQKKSPVRQPGRFETELLTTANLVALRELSGAWTSGTRERKPPKTIVLDMYSSESPTYGEQEGSLRTVPDQGQASRRAPFVLSSQVG